jgi:hypothetical protein
LRDSGVTKADIDARVMAVFDKMRVEDEEVKDWFGFVLASQTRDARAESLSQLTEFQRQETLLVQQQDRLLNLRISDDVDQATFARQSSCNSTLWTAAATKRPSWPRKFLIFRNCPRTPIRTPKNISEKKLCGPCRSRSSSFDVLVDRG